jgi:hypothetical protein
VQARQLQQANWEHEEILALVQIKKVKHKELMAKVDDWHKFETTISKWKKILTTIMKASCLEHAKKNPTCKD